MSVDSVQYVAVLAVCFVGVVLWKLCLCQFLSDLRRHCSICFDLLFIACLACLFGCWSRPAFDFSVLSSLQCV